MNWSGNTSKPIRSAEWRSPTKRISTPRSVHPCANYKTTPRKSAPSTKSQLSNTPHESEPTYGLINKRHPVIVGAKWGKTQIHRSDVTLQRPNTIRLHQ